MLDNDVDGSRQGGPPQLWWLGGVGREDQAARTGHLQHLRLLLHPLIHLLLCPDLNHL